MFEDADDVVAIISRIAPFFSTTMTVLPTITSTDVLACQFSSWYPRFASNSIKSTVIRPLSVEFVEYLNADGVIVPEGSGLEDTSVRDYLSVGH